MKNAKLIAFAVVFASGVLFKAILDYNDSNLITESYADVDGMSYIELRRDRDFKKAVQYIVENCSVYGSDISC